ncbi:cytochrome b5-related protein-like [Condylostylus longicornis]|uniref:cytochrome b5-related protein-like n=1 Tax=Condylostylus longicornis TaxID=2530218 RepID=UPI00244E3FB6|nr:cytochrome b5-related protein-like [Condylostylus longicornis]
MEKNGTSSKMKNSWEKSEISRKFPHTYMRQRFRTIYSWLDNKRIDEGAEGLWRIHDGLYDLKDFVKIHPGGSFWLKMTEGTDITEAFEAHHISSIPEQILAKYKVRDANEPRNYILTFKDDGFYRTLKLRAREKIKDIDHTVNKSDLIHTMLLLSTFITAITSVALHSIIGLMITSILMTWTVIASHNYFHQRDNWRMLFFNLSMLNYKEWRISHCMSHHIYTNSFHDLEITLLEPFFQYIPNRNLKTWIQRFGSWFYGPIIYSLTSWEQFASRIIYSILKKNVLDWDELIGFILPISMYLFTKASIIEVFLYWILLVTACSFIFVLIGLNAAHHSPDIIHDGDAIRSDKDWGIYQIDAVADSTDVKGSQFLTLTHFGNHTLHHLFPTLDHGILPQLFPILFETLKEFNIDWREFTRLDHIKGNYRQLARIEPNKYPRG